MSKVVPFGRKPETPDNHMVRDCLCVACGHAWTGVMPFHTKGQSTGPEDCALECPSCGALRGVYKKNIQHETGMQWTCVSCQGFLFTISLRPDSTAPVLMCAGCANEASAMDMFP